MGWVRISDDFYDHEKFRHLTVLGDALWVRALAYANRNLTDGIIPVRAARGLIDLGRLGAEPEDAIGELLAAGLWHADGHTCPDCPQPGARAYVFHDYLAFQPSREEVVERREETAARVRQHRARRRNAVTPPVTNAVSNGVSTTPPNPNPNVPTKTNTDPSVLEKAGPVDGPVHNAAEEEGRGLLDRARLFGFDPLRVRAVLGRVLGEIPSDDTVMLVAMEILGRAADVPADPTGYLVTSLRNPETNVAHLAYGASA